MTPRHAFALLIVLSPIASALLIATALTVPSTAHEGHSDFSTGEPGNPKKPSRTVNVIMREEGNKMLFDPATITVHKSEQIRFVLDNAGIENHEFVLATRAENHEHGELMKKYPNMEHEDPNAQRVAPFNRGELLWKFTKVGEFEFACLIPGHCEHGMFGKIVVK
jgi:uncharacterized cupredoxin-like copper-binding protein